MATNHFTRKNLTKKINLALTWEQKRALEATSEGHLLETISARQLTSPGSDAKFGAKHEPDSHKLSGNTSIDSTDLINRFLELEDQDHALHENLDRHEDRIEDIKQRMTEMETRLETELQAVKLLLAQKHEKEVSKKRLWDTISKEDIRSWVVAIGQLKDPGTTKPTTEMTAIH